MNFKLITEEEHLQFVDDIQRTVELSKHKDATFRNAFKNDFEKFITKWEQSYIETSEGVITSTPATERILTRL